MKKMDKIQAIKVAVATFFGCLTASLGILAIPFYLMLASNIVDYVSGILVAKHRNVEINSKRGVKGIVKKVLMWLLISVGFITDMLLYAATDFINIQLPMQLFFTCAVTLWLTVNECISILENIKDSGIVIPSFLEKVVSNIKSQVEEKGEK